MKKGFDFLRTMNTGFCKVTGKTFGEVMPYFIVGADESCLMADAKGMRIVGEARRKKHDKRGADFRGSITMLRTGSPAGTSGPTTFLMKGKRRNPVYTDSFLEAYGCAPGSSVAKTENAFMTDKA